MTTRTPSHHHRPPPDRIPRRAASFPIHSPIIASPAPVATVHQDRLYHPNVYEQTLRDFDPRTSAFKDLPPLPPGSRPKPKANSRPKPHLGQKSHHRSADSERASRDSRHSKGSSHRSQRIGLQDVQQKRSSHRHHNHRSSHKHHNHSNSSLSTISSVKSLVTNARQPPPPPSKKSKRTTASSGAPDVPKETAEEAVPEPTPTPTPTPYGLYTRSGSFQTRYMSMLLSLDKIPRLHNILASFFTWALLAGFVLFPGTFPLERAETAASPLSPAVWAVLLSLASGCTALGVTGMVWLSFRWRHNYVWLLNRVYLPATLNGLAGIIATLTAVYAREGGVWGVTALAAAGCEALVVLVCSALFVLYNNLLLTGLRQQHQAVEQGVPAQRLHTKGFRSKLRRMSQTPPYAPGSVV